MEKTIAYNWIKALTNGKYKQIKYHYEKDNGFCALGVLFKENNVSNKNTFIKNGRIITKMNDAGLSFKHIAEYIEKNYEIL